MSSISLVFSTKNHTLLSRSRSIELGHLIQLSTFGASSKALVTANERILIFNLKFFPEIYNKEWLALSSLDLPSLLFGIWLLTFGPERKTRERQDEVRVRTSHPRSHLDFLSWEKPDSIN